MKGVFIYCFLLVLLGSCTVHYELTAVKVGVLEAGEIVRANSEESVTGHTSSASNVKLLNETYIIYIDDIKKGQFLGFNYAIEKFKNKRLKPFKVQKYSIIIKSPPILKSNGETVTEQKIELVGFSNIVTYYGYVFSEEYEKVSGIWSFEFYVEEEFIGTVSFDVRDGSCMDNEKGLLCESWDIAPLFVGGDEKMNAFIVNEFKYPKETIGLEYNGDVIVGFIVSEIGELSDFFIVQKSHPYYNQEAIRIISMMPKWTPAIKDEKAIKTSFLLPISFQIR